MSAALVAVVVTSGERHEGKAGMVLFAGKTVWSMSERFVCTSILYMFDLILQPIWWVLEIDYKKWQSDNVC